MREQAVPKVFISYSWSSPGHEAWVLKLAEELAGSGVHVIIDKWDLGKGEDAHQFMERMVNDPEIQKVILVCDRVYREKANARTGGAGTEAQIITSELYGKTTNTKFCAVLSEKDDAGQAYLPTYFKTRIYIDMSDESERSEKFEELLRWVYDKPFHIRPTLGKRPDFLNETTTGLQLHTSTLARRASDAIRSHKPFRRAALHEYLDKLANGFEQLRIPYGPNFEDRFLTSITEFLPYRNEFLDIVKTCSTYDQGSEAGEVIHRFIERVLPFVSAPPDRTQFYRCEFDNFQFLIYEAFLLAVAIIIRAERFDLAGVLTQQDYFWDNPRTNANNSMLDRAVQRFGMMARVSRLSMPARAAR